MDRVQRIATALAVLGSACLTACAGGPSADPSPESPDPTPVAVSGHIDVVLDTSGVDALINAPDVGAQCSEGTGLAAGDRVVLESADGTVIGLGELAGGVTVNETTAPPNRACRLEFTVDVPNSGDLTGDFFTLQFGATGGTEFTLSAKELTTGPALQVGEYYWY